MEFVEISSMRSKDQKSVIDTWTEVTTEWSDPTTDFCENLSSIKDICQTSMGKKFSLESFHRKVEAKYIQNKMDENKLLHHQGASSLQVKVTNLQDPISSIIL